MGRHKKMDNKPLDAQSDYVVDVRLDAIAKLDEQMANLDAYLKAVKAAGGDYFAPTAVKVLVPALRAELGKGMVVAVQTRFKELKAVRDKLSKRG